MQPMKLMSYIYVSLLAIVMMCLPGTASAATNVIGSSGDNAPVCISLPILTGQSQEGCPAGQYRIDNNPATGGAIVSYLRLILRLMNMLVGAVVVLVIVIAGVQYVTSAGDPTNTKKAKTRVTGALTALLLYMLMVAILNFILPGGAL